MHTVDYTKGPVLVPERNSRRSAGNESTNANGAPAIASDHSKCTAEKRRVIPSGREEPRKRWKGQSRGPSVRAGLAFSLRMTTPASAETLFHRWSLLPAFPLF